MIYTAKRGDSRTHTFMIACIFSAAMREIVRIDMYESPFDLIWL
jgi:hypothetical protein